VRQREQGWGERAGGGECGTRKYRARERDRREDGMRQLRRIPRAAARIHLRSAEAGVHWRVPERHLRQRRVPDAGIPCPARGAVRAQERSTEHRGHGRPRGGAHGVAVSRRGGGHVAARVGRPLTAALSFSEFAVNSPCQRSNDQFVSCSLFPPSVAMLFRIVRPGASSMLESAKCAPQPPRVCVITRAPPRPPRRGAQALLALQRGPFSQRCDRAVGAARCGCSCACRSPVACVRACAPVRARHAVCVCPWAACAHHSWGCFSDGSYCSDGHQVSGWRALAAAAVLRAARAPARSPVVVCTRAGTHKFHTCACGRYPHRASLSACVARRRVRVCACARAGGQACVCTQCVLCVCIRAQYARACMRVCVYRHPPICTGHTTYCVGKLRKKI